MLAGGIELDVLVALAGIAMVAGFLDAIAGGGGLITLPALFIAGIDPVAAIATNKLQAASATVSATVAFARKGMIEWKKGYPIAIMAFVGGMTGALCVSIIPNNILKSIVPF
ncbi:TSUP family transporter, partial [Azotobacter beijerinckii]|uniref:TSUP family transporter n=1 Tax=Azotobacter beijerinckii TaxID=170623 RepID=UPI0015882457